MLRRFIAGSVLAQAFAPDARSGPERLAASPWATATTPDQIIVAHVLQSVVKQPDNWRWRTSVLPLVDLVKNYKKHDDVPRDARYGQEYHLIGPDITISFGIECDGSRPGWYVVAKVVANGNPLETEAGNLLTTRLGMLWSQLNEARKVAAKAKADMEANEAKWNLAEQLLGMKRNEHGALVPKD